MKLKRKKLVHLPELPADRSGPAEKTIKSLKDLFIYISPHQRKSISETLQKVDTREFNLSPLSVEKDINKFKFLTAALESGYNVHFILLQSKDLQNKHKSAFHFVIDSSPLERTIPSMPDNKFIKKINEIINSNVSNEKFSTKKLCEEAAMSRASLYRKFRSHYNKPVNKYLRYVRLLRARDLLFTSDIKVSEAAIRSGFNNFSHFSRIFKEEFGVSPRYAQKTCYIQ